MANDYQPGCPATIEASKIGYCHRYQLFVANRLLFLIMSVTLERTYRTTKLPMSPQPSLRQNTFVKAIQVKRSWEAHTRLGIDQLCVFPIHLYITVVTRAPAVCRAWFLLGFAVKRLCLHRILVVGGNASLEILQALSAKSSSDVQSVYAEKSQGNNFHIPHQMDLQQRPLIVLSLAESGNMQCSGL